MITELLNFLQICKLTQSLVTPMHEHIFTHYPQKETDVSGINSHCVPTKRIEYPLLILFLQVTVPNYQSIGQYQTIDISSTKLILTSHNVHLLSCRSIA